MKTSMILMALAAVLFAVAQEAPKPSGELIIQTAPNANLNSHYLRVTGGELSLDNTFSNCVLEVRWEAWRTNGGGQSRIVSKGELEIDMPSLKALMNAPNPKNALKNAILADAVLTESQ